MSPVIIISLRPRNPNQAFPAPISGVSPQHSWPHLSLHLFLLGGQQPGLVMFPRAGFHSEVSEMGWGKSAPKSPSRPALPPPMPTSYPSLPWYLSERLGRGFRWLGVAKVGGCEGEAHWHSGPLPLGSAAPHPQSPEDPRQKEKGSWFWKQRGRVGKYMR